MQPGLRSRRKRPAPSSAIWQRGALWTWTGRRASISPPSAPGISSGSNRRVEGIQASQRIAMRLVELRAPFELTRQAIDDVERGAEDSDWDPLKEAARKVAFAEDHAVFEGYAAGGIQGIRQGTSNPVICASCQRGRLPGSCRAGRKSVTPGGVNGPYTLVLGAKPYTAVSGGSEEGYPVLQHIHRLVDGDIVWAPAIEGGFVLTTRGGDFELDIGQDFSIGYLSHTASAVELYLQETFTFRLLTTEAAVALVPAEG